MRPALRQARTLLNRGTPQASIPVVLCPALLRAPLPASSRHVQEKPTSRRFTTLRQTRQQDSFTIPDAEAVDSHTLGTPIAEVRQPPRALPRACPGCGAPSQIFDKKEAGYYNVDRKVVRNYINRDDSTAAEAAKEDDVYANALTQISPELLGDLGLAPNAVDAPKGDNHHAATPVCDRCHNLVHHSEGSPIHHPTVESIQQTIAESPHRRNHIYHVVDAADFPLSIVPNLQTSLRIPKLRTQNRRAKHKGWVANDRIAEISFIITRADLLAPKKEQVDVLMPYVTDVLRDALGRVNNKARLGNVRLVSAKRGWWTKQVKDDIWERGGAGWMVGKVNVGKSNLFEAVFPKGRGADYQDAKKIRSAAEREEMLSMAKTLDELTQVQEQLAAEDAEIERRAHPSQEHLHEPSESAEFDPQEDFEDPDALLPPAQPFTLYPVLPIASSLPGTTASPIRVPFGRNRGELIDLPGLARTSPGLETFVQPTSHDTLVMKSRINSQRYSLKPGQSLILGGGLIRITPVTEDLVFLVYPFVPIHPHVTRTEKAIDYQHQISERQLQVRPILAPDVGSKMNSAGRFSLKWDVTKQMAGPMTSSSAGKMKPENLPFRIWSTDVLIEGVGWVEISAQTRRPQGWQPTGLVKKDPNHANAEKLAAAQAHRDRQQRKFDALARADREGRDAEEVLNEEFYEEDMGDKMAEWQEDYPVIEVFSPLGKFVGQRRPMCASLVGGPKVVSGRQAKGRPRRSMVSVKGQRKPRG